MKNGLHCTANPYKSPKAATKFQMRAEPTLALAQVGGRISLEKWNHG